ncbi:MAG: hypothetical protein PHU71_05415 [Candidatus Gracilibacteria bacterium]|nr:hypothetical protein [Candidatus Gracilibacteria bacterium]
MISEKLVFNPFTKMLQRILDKNTIAEKVHTHSISEVRGLTTILNLLNVGKKVSGGYFVN